MISAQLSSAPSAKTSVLKILFVACLLFAGAFAPAPVVAYVPHCNQLGSDSDGDGWGWENNQSCIVVGSGVDTALNRNPQDRHPVCLSGDSDSDGDGWGWENSKSCKVKRGKVVDTKSHCEQLGSDPDGDGWGWESGNSCVVYQPSDITDLILVTGQSNTLGAGTTVDPVLDAPNPRVFAYTSDGWQMAQLHQTWDRKAYPGPGTADAHFSVVYNNFALHFGKKLAELDPDRVVGFVLVSEPGEGIENWNPGSNGMVRVQSKVVSAINDLPHKIALDGVLWHQGETDWQLEGTSDPDVEQPALINYYPGKLSALISNLRNENWYSGDRPFICGETLAATGVNTHLNALNNDSDPLTACVPGFGLTATTEGGNHFNASSLRVLGSRYADSYFQLTN